MVKYQIVEDVLSKTVDEEEVIVNLSTGTYFGLNPTGTVIWNHLKKGSDASVIFQDLVEHFDSSEEELQQDMEQFITDLLNQKIIKKS